MTTLLNLALNIQYQCPVTCLARSWAAQEPCSEQSGKQACPRLCSHEPHCERAHLESAVLYDHVVVVGDYTQVVQGLQKRNLLVEGILLVHVLS